MDKENKNMASASGAGPSQAEPEVSALRASVPDAGPPADPPEWALDQTAARYGYRSFNDPALREGSRMWREIREISTLLAEAGIATCPRCGTRHKADGSNTSGEWKPIRVSDGLCDICAIGEHRARLYAEGKGTRWLIIGGHYMSPEAPVPLGDPDPRPNTPNNWKGCSGAKQHFQRDGCEPQTTYSMWHGGTVNEYMRARMPDNGRWLTDADAAQAIEARRAETGTGSVHESAVATPCAQPSAPSQEQSK